MGAGINFLEHVIGAVPEGWEPLRYQCAFTLILVVIDYVFRLINLPFKISRKRSEKGGEEV